MAAWFRQGGANYFSGGLRPLAGYGPDCIHERFEIRREHDSGPVWSDMLQLPLLYFSL